MRKFILHIVLFSLPLWMMLAAYVWFDPFKVVRNYANYRPGAGALQVPINQDHVSTSTFLFYNPTLHYNAFIFGSSRSMMYEVDSWKLHLPADAVCYHFDASAESIAGIAHKVKFIHAQGNSIKDVLIVLDESNFQPRLLLGDHLYAEDPRLCSYANVVTFHSAHFMAFLDRKFLRAYFDYTLTGQSKPYMTDNMILDNRPVVYEPMTNEQRFEYFEQLDDSGLYYTADRMKTFYARDGVYHESKPCIDENEQAFLTEMARIFEYHKTDVRIVISPLYNQRTFAPADKQVLQSVFGQSRVYDFSGVTAWTTPFTNYYERSHYRPHLAKLVVDSVYGRGNNTLEH